jgi:hypothetical protein
MTQGQELTATLRRYFSLGTRTRRFRTDKYGCRQDLHAEMIEALTRAATMPGYFSERTENALRAGFGVAQSYDKHVGGYRVSGVLRFRITSMSAWQFSAMLGEMVDAGVTNCGAGERFFSQMAKAA